MPKKRTAFQWQRDDFSCSSPWASDQSLVGCPRVAGWQLSLMGFWKLSLVPWFWVAYFYSKYGQEGMNNKHSQLPETFYCLGVDLLFSWMTFIFSIFLIALFVLSVLSGQFLNTTSESLLCSQQWQNCRHFKLSMKAWV